MLFRHHVLYQTRLAASIALVLLIGFATSAKSARTSTSHKATITSASRGVVLDLSDFGAAGDGVSDDGPALQSALDALAQAGGGTLFVPAGSYLIATPVAKDFSGLEAPVSIQGVPSLTMPAPPTASGYELSAGLNLTSEIIPATGQLQTAIAITNLHQLTIEDIGFSGRPDERNDAFVTLYLGDVDQATIRHCEFYGLSIIDPTPELGGGNIIRAVRSEMSIELSVFLGCTANSGAYAPIVENIEWRKFSISNSIFLDYGQRPFYGKMGLGCPLSWINMGNAAALTPKSSRREFVVRDTFLDEGGWIGITVLPYRFGPAVAPIDLVYISGLKMNVSNFFTAGHVFYDARNLLIENSHYGWSHNASAAIDVNRVGNAIFDNLTCIDHANRLHADAGTERLTVINSNYDQLDSLAQTTTVITTVPEQDPVQYVRQQFVSALGREPDPAAHFYWSDVLIKCGQNNDCLNQQHSALSQYLANNPQPEFSLAGAVTDENGDPIAGAAINLTGSQSTVALTDSQGLFRFAGLPTSGSYTVAVSKQHYSFTPGNQNFLHPAGNLTVNFGGGLNRHTISGRIAKADGTGVSGVTVALTQSSETSVTTDANGNYEFPQLLTGANYTVTPVSTNVVFTPVSSTFQNLSADQEASFVARPYPQLITIEGSDVAIAFDSVTFITEPFSIFSSPGFDADGFTRLMVFAKNLEHINDPSQVSAVAEDGEGKTYPLEIENMSDVAGLRWLKQLNIKLSADLPSGGNILLTLSVPDGSSNKARISLAAFGSSSLQVKR